MTECAKNEDGFKCLECGSTDIIVDSTRGEKICAVCGLVIEEKAIDTGPEYRVLDDSKDVIRVGLPQSLRFADKGLSTRIGYDKLDKKGRPLSLDIVRLGKRLQKTQTIGTSSSLQRNLNSAVPQLERYKTMLSLSDNQFDEVLRIYRKIVELGLIKGRAIDKVLVACIYIVFKQCNSPRSINEIQMITRVPKQTILSYYQKFVPELKIQINPTNPIVFVPSYCNKLNLHQAIETKTIKFIKKINPVVYTGKDPRVVAATAIYIIAKKSRVHITQRDVANVSGLNEVTIGGMCKILLEQYNLLKNSRLEHSEIK